MLGRFHEISITTADIRASVVFYESLGFTQVYDYVPGKNDWLAAGLPREGKGRGATSPHGSAASPESA